MCITLTTPMLRDMRKSDRLTFHLQPDGREFLAIYPDGCKTEDRQEIDFGRISALHPNFGHHGFASVSVTKYTTDTLAALVHSIFRRDDQIMLRWIKDGATNQYTKIAQPAPPAGLSEEGKEASRCWDCGPGLHGDMLQLVLVRPGKRTGFKAAFTISESICPNNSARMIRRA